MWLVVDVTNPYCQHGAVGCGLPTEMIVDCQIHYDVPSLLFGGFSCLPTCLVWHPLTTPNAPAPPLVIPPSGCGLLVILCSVTIPPFVLL